LTERSDPEAPSPPAPEPPPDGPLASDAAPGYLGLTTFTIEGRRAPGLFVVGWLATLAGVALTAIVALGASGFGGNLLGLHHPAEDFIEDGGYENARMDKLGIFILIFYILFVLVRHWFLEHWLRGSEITAFSLSFATGSMIGRVWTIRRNIRRRLKEQNII